MNNNTTPLLFEDERTGLPEAQMQRLLSMTARQQPAWASNPILPDVRRALSEKPPLVGWGEVRTLRALLADVAEGRFQVIQAGDCAEDPADCAATPVSLKIGLLDAIAEMMWRNTNKPLIRVGRIAGQFAKPRSQATETVDGVELPVYRGHLINGPEPDPDSRRPDPLRMLDCYAAAQRAMHLLRDHSRSAPVPMDPLVWTSHEALVLDYEVPLIRRSEDGKRLLTSTHWPWIGERTRQPDGAHVQILGSVINPVSCKVGPDMSAEAILALCRVLDPDRTPGRLTFITRMGADIIGQRLPRLVSAVRAAAHPVIWMCDPMHGNTITSPSGVKTRLVPTVRREIEAFLEAVDSGGGVAGGLHLEATSSEVIECVWEGSGLASLGPCITSLCDPRLNLRQSLEVTSAWAPAGGTA